MILKKNWTPGAGLPPPRGNIQVYYHNVQRSSSLKLLSQSKPNFMWSILRKGERVYINDPGHMTKMAAMAINSKNLQKSSPEPEGL